MPKKIKEKPLFQFDISIKDTPDTRTALKVLTDPDQFKAKEMEDMITNLIFGGSIKAQFIKRLTERAHELFD